MNSPPRHWALAGSEAEKLDAEPFEFVGALRRVGAAVPQRNACFVAGGQGWAGPADHLVSLSPPLLLQAFLDAAFLF